MISFGPLTTMESPTPMKKRRNIVPENANAIIPGSPVILSDVSSPASDAKAGLRRNIVTFRIVIAATTAIAAKNMKTLALGCQHRRRGTSGNVPYMTTAFQNAWLANGTSLRRLEAHRSDNWTTPGMRKPIVKSGKVNDINPTLPRVALVSIYIIRETMGC